MNILALSLDNGTHAVYDAEQDSAWFKRPKPRAVPLSALEEIDLGVDELEAIRLCDLEGLNQIKVAKRMRVSQSALGRILTLAHKKVAEALTK